MQLKLLALQPAHHCLPPLRRLSGLPRAAQHRLRCAHDVILKHPLFFYPPRPSLARSLSRHFCCSISTLKKRERDARALNPVCGVTYGEDRKKEKKRATDRAGPLLGRFL